LRYKTCLNSLIEFLNKPYPREELNEISKHNVKLFHSGELYNGLVDRLINDMLNNYINCRERDDYYFRNQ